MATHSIVEDEQFWRFFDHITKLGKNTKLKKIANDLGLSLEQANKYCRFAGSFIKELETIMERDDLCIKPIQWNSSISINLTVPEWIKFQAHFPYLAEAKDKPFHGDILKKLASLEAKYEDYDLYKFNPERDLQAFIEDKVSIQLGIGEKLKVVYPRKLMVLDSELTLIGENTEESSLESLPINHIDSYKPVEKNWEQIYSDVEIDDFVSSLRLISDSCLRLVLKIYGPENFHVDLKTQFIEKPCLFTNLKGESIWAATVEPGEEIFEWLLSMGNNIEILDPMDFKKKFLEYCESHLKKIA